ncbi:MAG: M1 family metallopeptidase [Vicinamibacteria bacterium]
MKRSSASLRYVTLSWLLVCPVVASTLAQEEDIDEPVSTAVQEEEQDEEVPVPIARTTNYRIEVELDAESKTLEGRQTITWENVRDEPTDTLWFHLYWNAWRNNRSSWMLENRIRRRFPDGGDIAEGDWSYINVSSVRLLPGMGYGESDLTAHLRFASPDDGNTDDRTVVQVPLSTPVGPGETIQVELVWRSKIPRTFARTGFRGDYFFIAHWFPKLGVFEESGWNNHQFHAATEFYSDYGTYDVSMTVPESYVLGATGEEVDVQKNPDSTVTYRYRQDDVHDFAWTTSPDYVVREAHFTEPGLPPVDMRLLIQPEHLEQAERHFDATRAALLHYGNWFGAYPYDHVTIVDPAYGSGAGGMEYPTLFTAGTRLINPIGGGSPEGVTIHEAGHQFWYGVVGNNEFEHAWLDEGLNTFSESRVNHVANGEYQLVRRYLSPPGLTGSGFFPVLFRDIRRSLIDENGLNSYRESAIWDAQVTPTYEYYPATANGITYSKTGLWLLTLERYLGWDVLQRILSTFYERWRFRHPTPQDFFDTANEVSGRDLTWFFDQVYWGSNAFDYAIDSVSSDRVEVEGFVEQGGQGGNLEYSPGNDEPERYRTEVVVRRIGGAMFPVEVQMVFADGTQVRKQWDGVSRWQLYVEERPSRLEFAVVDPDRKLALDLNYTNNSRRLEPESTLPARKWASKWMIWLQDLLATFAFFV